MLSVTRHGRVEKVQGATESGVEWRGVEWSGLERWGVTKTRSKARSDLKQAYVAKLLFVLATKLCTAGEIKRGKRGE